MAQIKVIKDFLCYFFFKIVILFSVYYDRKIGW